MNAVELSGGGEFNAVELSGGGEFTSSPFGHCGIGGGYS